MTRESLGQFRIHLFTCDDCGREERTETRGSRQVVPPAGWRNLSLSIGSKTARADLCSQPCVERWTAGQLAPAEPVNTEAVPA